MKNRVISLIFFLTLVVTARAATLIQSQTLPVDQSYRNVTDDFEAVPGSYFVATFDPFDTSLGVLQSFTITWEFTATVDAILRRSGGIAVSAGGNIHLGPMYMANDGVSSGAGGESGDTVSYVLLSGAMSATLPVTDVRGELLAPLLSGDDVVTSSWNAPVKVTNYSGSPQTLEIHGAATATLTYTYAAVPEPGTPLISAAASFLLLRRRRSR